jgi:hypothetical protein
MADQSNQCERVGKTKCARDRVAVRSRVERFARVRSAARALPASAQDLAAADENSNNAANLRTKLSQLVALEGTQEQISEALAEAQPEVDAELDAMAHELRTRVEQIDFAQLRATIPQFAELHRKEVVALLEVLLEEPDAIESLIPRIEYLITMLSTETQDGQRAVKHDPSALSPFLASFEGKMHSSRDSGAVAIEFYEAATFGSDDPKPKFDIRRTRKRKAELGVDCLVPEILRAIVTYNARLYNYIEASRDASCAEDLTIESLFASPGEADGEAVDTAARSLDEDDEIWARIGRDPEVRSVMKSDEIKRIQEAMARRLSGIPIGSSSSERVALALDVNELGAFERSALVAANPGDEQDVIARTVILGLMNRDLGSIRSEATDMGIRDFELTNAWVRELSERFGRLVSAKALSPDDYDLARELAAIKAKHLFTPVAVLNAGKKRTVLAEAPGEDDAAQEMRKVGREAAHAASNGIRQIANFYTEQSSEPNGGRTLKKRRIAITSAPLMFLLSMMSWNWITAEPLDAETLSPNSLSRASAHLASAYRSGSGDGGMLIGQLDPDYLELKPLQQYEAAKTMAARLGGDGVREGMIYDSRHKLRIHFAQGKLRLPVAPPPDPSDAEVGTSH